MLLKLFKTFFKIGALTFGGGYAMISVVKDECVDNNHWLKEEEFVNLIAVSESTPGPISINMATYIGYKQKKLLGAFAATLGVILPSIIVIYIISLFFIDVLNIKEVADAFFGIRIAVAIVIIRTAYNLIKNEYKISDKKVKSLAIFLIYAILLLICNFFKLPINSISLILSSIIFGSLFVCFT